MERSLAQLFQTQTRYSQPLESPRKSVLTKKTVQLPESEVFVSSPQRSLCFDLENRPLAYWYDGQTTSEITAFAWKWSDQSFVHAMLLMNDGWFDFQLPNGHRRLPAKDAYEFFVRELTKADLIYGHNIRRHDLPMLNAGLLRRQLPILPALKTTDTLADYPKRAGMSRSLDNLAVMYGLEGKKLGMSQPAWEDANRLTADGIALARERVVGDVLLQERLRTKLLELGILKPPRMWRP